MNCEHCQTLLLDHLYGLLDGPEAEAVRAHLETCPACAGARAETARVQGLFARAAKSTFPNTKFEPPVPVPVPKVEPRVSVTPARSALADRPGREGKGWRVAAVVPWVVAAAVLLAVPGTVVPVLDIFHKAEEAGRVAETARRGADESALATASVRKTRDARLGDAQVKLAAAEQTRVALFDRWLDEQKSVAQTAGARKLTVEVQKPATVQPGAPNDFLVVLRDERAGTARRAQLVAEVRASDAVLFSQPLDHEKRGHTHPIRLPASVWTRVKPDAELTLVVAEVDEKTQARTPLQEVRLAGPVFATLLVTDKPVYRPGERLFFRSLTLDRVTLKPPANEQALRYDLVAGATLGTRAAPVATATGSTGLVRVGGDGRGLVEPVRTADGKPVRGVGCGEFVLPASLADGEYTLVLRELPASAGGPVTLPMPVTRTVKVRAGRQDAYAKQIGFAGASFASGDTVEAWAELKLQDRPVAGAEIVGVAVLADGVPVSGVEAAPTTDALGRTRLRFALPPEVLDGDVRVKVTFRSAEGVESVADRVPVISRRLHVEFFPESGAQVVAGVPCKVYVRATTPAGQPVDISGIVTNGRETLATVKTLRDESERGANRGLASFTFTPQAGTRTWLKLDAPNGVYAPVLEDVPIKVAEVAGMGGMGAVAGRTGFALPDAQLDGVVMSVPEAVTAPGQPFGVHLYSVGQPRTLVVGAYVRGRLADTQRVHAEAGQLTEVKLMAGADPRGGVVRVTAFEEVDAKNRPDRPDLKPVAERLVFRRPGEVLNLSLAVTPAGSPRAAAAFAPGTAMSCTVSATDEKNDPVAAVLWAAVVNTGVAPGARDRSLPTHFFLAGDVKSPDALEYADFLLTDHPKAREALDLVLGTQGWRRFAEQNRAPFAGGRPAPPANFANSELTRLMVQNGQNAVWADPVDVCDARRVADTYAPLYESAVQAVARAQAALDATREQVRDPSEVQRAQAAESVAKAAAAEQAVRAEAAREPVRRFRSGVWYGVAGFVGLALLCGGVSLARPQTRLPLGFSTAGAFGLAAFLFVAAGWGDEARGGQFPTADVAPAQRDLAKVVPPVPELAPAPRLVTARDGRGAGAKFASGGLEMKVDSFAKGGGAGGGGFNGPGFAPPAFGGPPPGAGTPVKGAFPVPPATGPGGRVAEPKLGMAPTTNAAPGGLALPTAPFATHPAKPLAVAPGVTGATGWQPARPNEVTASDLAWNAPSDTYFWRSAFRFRSEDRVADLKKATDDATQFAHERQRKLAESIESQSAGRGMAKAPGADSALNRVYSAPLTPAKIEEDALQQMRGTVNSLPPLVVREYANPRPSPAQLADAGEAPDTLLWQPAIVLPADGKAVLHFALGSAPGGYRVLVAGHTADGRLGEARTVIVIVNANAPAVTTPPRGSIPTGVPAAPSPRP